MRRLLVLVAAVATVSALLPAALADTAEDAEACPLRDVPPAGFADVGGVHALAIDCAAWWEVAAGVAADRFDPAASLRRDQVASMLAGLVTAGDAELPEPGDRFDDLEGNTHRDAIERLAAAGVVSGTGERTYGPAEPIRRDQFATMLVRTIEHIEDAELPAGDHDFTDVEGNPHEHAIAAATGAGLVSGVAADRYAPNWHVTRAQTAALLTRSLDRFVTAGRVDPPPAPGFVGGWTNLPREVRERMEGVSWREGCPVGMNQLGYVTAYHRGFDGRIHAGEMVVSKRVADDVVDVLETMFDADFPLERMVLVDDYGNDDAASMADNNTYAFSCRRVTGGSSWSQHAYGTAIDFNPIQNPYVRGDTVLPPAGRPYAWSRDDVRPGMIVEGDEVVAAFDAIGWGWGGRWQSLKDYMHVSESGR